MPGWARFAPEPGETGTGTLIAETSKEPSVQSDVSVPLTARTRQCCVPERSAAVGVARKLTVLTFSSGEPKPPSLSTCTW